MLPEHRRIINDAYNEPKIGMSAIASQMETLVGADAVQTWEHLPLPLQSQIQAALAPDHRLDCVVYPSSPEQLAEVMACAHQNRWRVLPWGNGTKLHWGGLASGVSLGISTARLNRLVDHAVGDLTCTVEAGISWVDLQRALHAQRQWLPIAPNYGDRATLGGIVATANTGSIRHRYGGIRDLLIGISVVRYDGKGAKAGGRVVKNVAGYDLMKLFTGSWGTLGIITQLTLRLYPQPDASTTVILKGNAEAIAAVSQSLLASSLTPTSVDLLSPDLMQSIGLGSEMGLWVRFQGIPVSIEQQSMQLWQWGESAKLCGDRHQGEAEETLWQQLQERWENSSFKQSVYCKIGVLPTEAVMALRDLGRRRSPLLGLIHLGTGLGMLQIEVEDESPSLLTDLRQACQTHGGFLSMLDAPTVWKQSLDVWGYAGNALPTMQRLKQQFDPHQLLSPDRFLKGL